MESKFDPDFPPNYRDWSKLRHRLPGERSKRMCNLAEGLHRKIKTATRTTNRGHRPDSELLLDINNTVEALVKETLMLILRRKGQFEKLEDVLENLKTVRKNIREEWEELINERNNAKVVGHLKETSDFLFSIVYSSLLAASRDVGKELDGNVASQIIGKLVVEVEPRKVAEEEQQYVG